MSPVVAVLFGLIIPCASVMLNMQGNRTRHTARKQALHSKGFQGLQVKFFYEYRASSLDDLSSFLSTGPGLERVDQEVNYGSTGSNWPGVAQKDYFAAQWTGSIMISTAGPYEFAINSDDGSKLSINSQLLIDNDGLHGMVTKTGTVDLPAGSHDITLDFFEHGGGAGMILYYKGPDTNGDKIVIPGSVLNTDMQNPPAEPAEDSGLTAKFYYDYKDTSLGDFYGLTPSLERKDLSVNYGSTSSPWSGVAPSDFFAAQWTGSIMITTPGMYEFSINSDDGSRLFVNNAMLVDNDGLHGMVTKTGTIDLPAGSHDLILDFFEHGGGAGMIFKYKGPDTNENSVVVPWTVLSTDMQNPPPTPAANQGLNAEFFYFPSGMSQLPDLSGETPAFGRVDRRVNYGSTSGKWSGMSQSDNFAVRWTGFLIITMPGTYEFSTDSDDGSKLLIEGVLLDNDGLHGMLKKSVQVSLSAGCHPIAMEMFENGGGAGMIFRYKGPDSGELEVVVPPSALGTDTSACPTTTSTTTTTTTTTTTEITTTTIGTTMPPLGGIKTAPPPGAPGGIGEGGMSGPPTGSIGEGGMSGAPPGMPRPPGMPGSGGIGEGGMSGPPPGAPRPPGFPSGGIGESGTIGESR